jgi:hypothetical protein
MAKMKIMVSMWRNGWRNQWRGEASNGVINLQRGGESEINISERKWRRRRK